MSNQSQPSTPSCAICLDPTIKLPVTLECDHHFCFLCIKSVLDTDPNPKCPLCRRAVNLSSDDLKIDQSMIQSLQSPTTQLQHTYYWQYAGRNFGWWNYQDDMSSGIEKAYRTYLWKEREKQMDQEYDDSESSDDIDYSRAEITVINTDYILDFVAMEQINKQNPGKKRKIQRVSMYDQQTKGTAGLRDYYD